MPKSDHVSTLPRAPWHMHSVVPLLLWRPAQPEARGAARPSGHRSHLVLTRIPSGCARSARRHQNPEEAVRQDRR